MSRVENASLLYSNGNHNGYELVKSYRAIDEEAVEPNDINSSEELDEDHRKCSVFETSCNLICVTMGSGILSLPYAAASFGWSSFIVLAALGIILTYGFDLLAKSMNMFASQMNLKPDSVNTGTAAGHPPTIAAHHIDYIVLGKHTMGKHGETLVMTIFATELLLALMSLLMTIAINMQVVAAGRVSFAGGIFIAAIANIFLSSLELKLAAYSSAVGTAMTVLTILAIIGSGIELESFDSTSTTGITHEYKFFDLSGLSMASGLVAFCYGGHSTFPKLYTSMKEPHRYREVILSMLIVVLFLYMMVMGLGYYFYAQYTLAPVTLNIGRDLTGTYFLPHGKALRLLAAIGVVCNLSVSCPLVTLPLRDAVLRLMCPKHDDASNNAADVANSSAETSKNSSPRQQVMQLEQMFADDSSSIIGNDNSAAVHNSSMSSITSRGNNNNRSSSSTGKHWLQLLAAFGVTASASTFAICLQYHFAAACSLVGAVASFTDSIILPLVFYHRLHPVCTYRLWMLHAVMLLISFITFGGGLVGNFCAQFPTVC